MVPVSTVLPRRTARLTLRALRPDDVPALVAIRRDPDVGRWLVDDVIDEPAYTRKMINGSTDPHEYEAVIVLDDRIIGNAGITVEPTRRQASSGPANVPASGDIGYILDSGYAGHGFATEIVLELLAIAFIDLELHRVTADCFTDNVGSWRVLEKAGLRREAHLVGSVWHTSLGWMDEYHYAILREEWHALRAQPEPCPTTQHSMDR